ncbi:MAG: DMT family transporter [Bacteroidales bacterium]|jgi:drug/metabolite transporter (DMT)-like permease|nr:DMT family transporter [Bacteroidales bacterium]MCU0408231.1 DMT family transporter [Bacteroidales bacterium]
MEFIHTHSGEFAALLTAVFWTVTSLAFESATNRIGSIAVNILRLIIGLSFLSLFTFFTRGLILPADASTHNWLWLSLSGLVGFVFGDLFLFKSYQIIGSRFSMLIMTLVPPITAFFGFVIIGERLTLFQFLGMLLTFSGIALAIFSRNGKGEKLSLKLAPRGMLYAFGGALGQALGLVLSKLGMGDYDPFAATQIRIIAGIAGFSVLISVMGRWSNVSRSLGERKAMLLTTLGALFGPFLGVSFSLVAIKHTEAGIASTIMAIVPVLILVPAVIVYRQKVTFAELAGALLSVGGIAVFFI